MVESIAAFVSHIRDPQFLPMVKFISRETVDERQAHLVDLLRQYL